MVADHMEAMVDEMDYVVINSGSLTCWRGICEDDRHLLEDPEPSTGVPSGTSTETLVYLKLSKADHGWEPDDNAKGRGHGGD